MLQICVYGGLAFLLVTLVLYALSFQRQQLVERHDLLRQVQQERRDYQQKLAQLREEAATGLAAEEEPPLKLAA